MYVRSGLILLGATMTAEVGRLEAQQRPRSVTHEIVAPVPAPSCDAPRVLCIRDTTRSVSIGECCVDYSTALWITFAARSDSIEFFTRPAASVSATSFVAVTKPGRSYAFWKEHLPGLDAPFLRHRFETAAPHVLDVDLQAVTPVLGTPYELRVRTVTGTPLSPSRSTLRLVGDSTTWFSLQIITANGVEPASTSDAMLRPGIYRLLAPASDSLRACRIPCTTPRTFSAVLPSPVVVR